MYSTCKTKLSNELGYKNHPSISHSTKHANRLAGRSIQSTYDNDTRWLILLFVAGQNTVTPNKIRLFTQNFETNRLTTAYADNVHYK